VSVDFGQFAAQNFQAAQTAAAKEGSYEQAQAQGTLTPQQEQERMIQVLNTRARKAAESSGVSLPVITQFLAAAGWAYDKVNQTVATPLLAANPRYWQNREGTTRGLWSDANDVSIGQAAMGLNEGIFGSMDTPGSGGIFNVPWAQGNDEENNALAEGGRRSAVSPGDADFNITDPAQRKAAFEDSAAGRVTSGATDLIAMWYLDPFVLAGKGAKLARMSFLDRPIVTEGDAAQLVLELSTDRAARMSGGFSGKKTAIGEFSEWAVGQTKIAPIEQRLRAMGSSDAASTAHLLRESTDRDMSDLVIGAAAGHRESLDALWEKSASAADQLVREQSKWDELAKGLDDSLHDVQTSLFDDLIDPVDPALIERQRKVVADLAAQDEFLAQAKAQAFSLVGAKTTASRSLRVERSRNRRATARAQYDIAGAAGWRSDYYQRNPFSRGVSVVRWVNGERPSGRIFTKGATAMDQSREAIATLNSVRIYKNDPARKEYLLEQFLANQGDDMRRSMAAVTLREQIAHDLAKHHGLTDDQATEFYKLYKSKEMDAQRKYLESGDNYWIEPNGDIVHVPQLESQLANSVTMPDFKLMDRALAAQGQGMGAWRSGLDFAKRADRTFQELWRPAVLLRVGYAQRNVADGYLRSMAFLGSVTKMVDPASVGRFAGNTGRRAQRLAGRVGMQRELRRSGGRRGLAAREADYMKARYRDIDTMRRSRELLVKELDEIRPAETGEIVYRIDTRDFNLDEGFKRPHGLYMSPLDDASKFEGNIHTRVYVENEGAANIRQVRGVIPKNLPKLEGFQMDTRGLRQAGIPTLEASAGISALKRWGGDNFDALTSAARQAVNPRKAPPGLQRMLDDLDDTVEWGRYWDNWERLEAAGAIYARRAGVKGFAMRQGRETDEVVLLDRSLLSRSRTSDGWEGRAATDVEPRHTPEMDDLQRSIDEMDQAITKAETKLGTMADRVDQWNVRKRSATGEFKVKGINLPEALGDPRYASIAEMNLSAQSTMNAALGRSVMNQEKRLRERMNEFGARVDPTHDNYFEEVVRVLNNQVRQSETARLVLSGADEAEYLKYVRSGEGRKVRTMLKLDSDEAAIQHYRTMQERLDALIPDGALRQRVLKGDVSIGQVRTALSGKRLVPVHGAQLANELASKGFMDHWRDTTSKLFHFLSVVPEDAFIRRPFYAQRYRDHLETSVAALVRGPDETVPAEMLQQAINSAHRRALRDTKETLYTIDRYTNLAGAIESFSPFLMAQQNALRVWGRLIWQNPAVVGRAIQLWNAPDNARLTDENGDIVIPIPGADSLSTARIPKNSITSIMFGNPNMPADAPEFVRYLSPLMPGVGPYITVAASKLYGSWQPDAPGWLTKALGEERGQQIWTGVSKYIFGDFGPGENPLEAVPPAWGRQLKNMLGGTEDRNYASTFQSIYLTEVGKFQLHQRETMPTPEEIEDRTKQFYMMRITGALTLPVSPRYESPFEPWFDLYRKYREDYGAEASARWYEDYGDDFYWVTSSLSDSKAGVDPTAQAVSNFKKYPSLVSKLATIDPDDRSFVGLATNDPTGGYEFDANAYAYQFNTEIAPGVGENLRETKGAAEAWDQNRVSLGWTKWTQFTDELDAVLHQRGLHSYQQSGAEDLADLKRQMAQKLGTEIPEWARDRETNGSSRASGAIKAFRAMLTDETYMRDHAADPQTKAIQEYLAFRDDVMALLAERAAAGYGSTLDAVANQDLANLVDQMAGKLKAADPGFAYIYDRYLESDKFTEVPGG